MDQERFDALTRSLGYGASRRGLGRLLAGGGCGAFVGSVFGALDVAAKSRKKNGKKRKDKKQNRTRKPSVATPQLELPPLVFNKYGCLDVGQPCRGDNSLCCSGICQGAAPAAGQPDASTCVAHNASFCTAAMDTCTVGANVPCRPGSVCTLTTGNAGFCADFTGLTEPAAVCRVCSRDTDCQAEFGPGAACLVLAGICSQVCPTTGGTACAPPGA